MSTPEEQAQAFAGEAVRSVRRSLFHRLKGLGLDQDAIARMVPATAKAAIERSAVMDLAKIAAASTPLRDALHAANPTDPALAAFDGVKETVGQQVQDLLAPGS